MKTVILLGLWTVGISAKIARQERRFPDDFIFGAATAAYQIEGGWNADGKGENIWDYETHNNPGYIKDLTNGDIVADTYHNYKRDVEMMRELGLDAYRFSLSWARILPEGFSNKVNEAGVAFYNNYINEMLEYNIQPLVTLYHWDLPQKLQELGGFANPLFAEWFEDYARVAFGRFGDRVKFWITFNEPREICYEGYGADTKAPVVNATGIGTYICAKNLLIAHAKAYLSYVKDFKPAQNGQCGITISVNWFGPATESDEDKFAAELRRQAEWSLYADPIFSEQGGFPKELSERVAAKSAEQGYSWSRMASFTDAEKDIVKGSFDFFGVNHYSSSLVSASEHVVEYPVPSLYDDSVSYTYTPDDWPKSASSWLVQAPNSVYNAFTFLRNRYGDLDFYITENGWSSTSGDLNDDDRVRYYRASLNSLLDAREAGVNIKGFMAWSLMDNFEWNAGLTERLGLYAVDFEDPARPRTPKKSAFVYKHILKHRRIDPDYEPDSFTITIDDGR